ncbi:hypothetical protein BB558_005764, partial [Smittium angustum]
MDGKINIDNTPEHGGRSGDPARTENIFSSETNPGRENSFDELARRLGGIALTIAEDKKVNIPSTFSGDWTESPALWMERYEKYIEYEKGIKPMRI